MPIQTQFPIGFFNTRPGSQQGIVYLARYLFPEALSAPLDSPYSEGQGSLTLVQSDGQYSVERGAITFPAQTTPVWGDQCAMDTTAYERVCGRAIYGTIRRSATTGTGMAFGWWNTATPGAPSINLEAGVQFGSTTLPYNNPSFADLGITLALNTDHEIVSILRSTGFWVVINNKLEWIGAAGTGAVYAGVNNHGAAGRLNYELALRDLGGMWASDYGPATNRVASPANGETTTSEADGLVEFTWTPASSETLDIQFRRVDDDNTLILRCAQAGTIKVFEKVAGDETEKTGGTTTQTFTAGTPYRVVVKFVGTAIKAWVGATAKNVTTSTLQQSSTGVKVTGFTTGANLVAWPYSLPDILGGDPERYYAGFGDSKTWLRGYQPYLNQFLITATGRRWGDINLGINGYAASQWVLVVDAELAEVSQTPEFVLFNLGANDVHDPLPSETNWKSYIRTLWRALHTKWSSAPIYVMRVWRRNYDADCDTAATWLADLQAEPEFSGYVTLGPDERVFIENGDDGTTYTNDGVHPNNSGWSLTAQQWLATLGY